MYIPLYDTHLSLSVYIAVYNIRPRSLPTESRRTDPPRATPAHGARRCRGQQHSAERRCTGAVPRRARGRSFGRKPIRTTGGPSTGRSWRAVGGGRGACRWAETGVVSGEGGAWAAGAAEAASGAPEENGGLFTFCSSSANGRASARVPARRRGQLRRRPRWRRRGLALSGRCSRAQRRRAGRLLPRQVTRTAPGRAPGAAGPDLAEEGEAAGGCAAERAAEAGARAAVGRAAGASRGPGSPGRRGHGWRPAVPVGALPPPPPPRWEEAPCSQALALRLSPPRARCRCEGEVGDGAPARPHGRILRVCHPAPGHLLVPRRCILLETKKRSLWSGSLGFSASAYGVETGSSRRPVCPSSASGTGTALRRWKRFFRLWSLVLWG